MPDIEEIAKNIVDNVVEEAKKVPDALESLVKEETKKFIADVKDPALQLGESYVRAILFGAVIELDDPAPDLSAEEMAKLTLAEAAQYQAINEKRSEQMALIATAFAEQQTAAAELREKANIFVKGLLSKVGSIGLKILAAGLIAI